MEDVWEGRGDECALAISPAIKIFLSRPPVGLCYTGDVAEGHTSSFVKRQDLNGKKDLKRIVLVIHIGACQRLFKWPVI